MNIDELKREVIAVHAPWLLYLEELEARIARLEQPPETHDTTTAGYTERLVAPQPMSEQVCARPGCDNLLTKQQARSGGKYCSISCATKANKPWLTRKGVARGKNSRVERHWKPTVTVEAGVGVTKGEV